MILSTSAFKKEHILNSPIADVSPTRIVVIQGVHWGDN